MMKKPGMFTIGLDTATAVRLPERVLMRRRVAGLLVGLAGFGTAACGHPDTTTPNSAQPMPTMASPADTGTAITSTAQPATTTPSALPESTPVRVTIPKINVTSTLVPLGLERDETVAVPPLSAPLQAGWYAGGPTPGEAGPAVILGHVDGMGKPGIFYRLRELGPGDIVLIAREDGGTAQFVVFDKQQVAKVQFPTDRVYGDTPDPQLRLITCGGTFNRATGNYLDNIIVYAKFAP
jgi:sortase (surface protein transpeptidase)